MINEMDPAQLLQLLEQNKKVYLVDIREEYEYEEGHLPAHHMPMDQVMDASKDFPKDCPVVIYCQSSKRSSAMAYMLRREKGLDNVFSVTGGYEAITQLKS